MSNTYTTTSSNIAFPVGPTGPVGPGAITFDANIMKQQSGHKRISDLPPVKWFQLENETAILVSINKETDQTDTCQTTLGDLKRYLLNEILEALEKRGAEAPPVKGN